MSTKARCLLFFQRTLLNTLVFLKKFFDIVVFLLGPVLVLVATVLISFIIVIHFKMILPYYTPYDSFGGIIHLIFSFFIAFNIVFNYYMVIFTPPGEPPALPIDEQELERLRREAAPRKGEGFSRYCKLCKKTKPPRSHHCHVCKRCVLRMDHHCPWVSNCVGFYNHKYFTLFLLYLWLGCMWVCLLSFVPFTDAGNFKQQFYGFSSRGTVMFTFILTLSVGIALAFMLGWHLYLAFTAQTTIEFYYNRYKKSQANARGEDWHNEYDLGTMKNFQLFFGSVGKRDFMPWFMPSVRPPPGDGINYITRTQYQEQSGLKNEHYV